DYIVQKLKREPNELELYLFSAMYSEHCGYKHSRLLLQNLNREGGVFCSENAGGIEIGDYTVVFKIESHNHPSAVEPFNGAATGIGGIIRDILAMNARPVALMNSLKFGLLQNPLDKRLLDGVVAGISHYGNCIGVPTIGGEVEFSERYASQPLVNVMAVGFAKSKDIKTSKATVGQKLLLLGSKTGVDGLGGAAFASKELDDDGQNRLSVQIADPFMKKRLIEATLEIFRLEGVEACQDCGAAGILSSTSEMGYKSHTGVDLYLDKVHSVKGIKPYEIMLSETQERMVFALFEDALGGVFEIAKKYDLQASVIGETTTSGDYNLYWDDELLASVPCDVLAQPPFYELKTLPDEAFEGYGKQTFSKDKAIEMISDPNFASKKYIFEQYDSTVQGRCIIPPNGANAAALWLKEADCVLGFSIDSRPFDVEKNSYQGTFDTVVESYKNLVAAGFEPRAISNCLNFGNPEKPKVADSFVKAVKGMNDALLAFDMPVVSGNVSFYNEYKDGKIFPTPTIAMLGVAKDYKKLKRGYFKEGETLALVGDLGFCADVEKIISLKKFISQKQIKACLNLSRGGIWGTLFRGGYRSGVGFCAQIASLDAFYNYPNCFLVSVKNTSVLNAVQHKILGEATSSESITFDGIEFDKKSLFELYESSIENMMAF
ncbi:MAG: phosphoribosylformylglycinamidine synthase subunit PurL, partial [Candidatus Gastranaerophilales bacterium]|nr:phosphoribosylformylglycinamidine synthase subunit PurL [Candidatus Gastranaerophilales bacterium]